MGWGEHCIAVVVVGCICRSMCSSVTPVLYIGCMLCWCALQYDMLVLCLLCLMLHCCNSHRDNAWPNQVHQNGAKGGGGSSAGKNLHMGPKGLQKEGGGS